MFVTFSLSEFILKKNVFFLGISCRWPFWVIKQIWYIIGNQPRSPCRIKHNHELQWPYGRLGYWHYSNERQRYSTLSSVEALIEVYLSANGSENHRRSDINIICHLGYQNYWYWVLASNLRWCYQDMSDPPCRGTASPQDISPNIWTSISVWWNIRRIQHGNLTQLVSNW
jgi:hypothetical protein